MQNRMESNIRDKFLVKMIKLQEFTEKKRIAEMLNEMNPKLKALLAAGLIGTAGLGMQSCSNPSDSVYYPYTVEAPSTDNPGSGGGNGGETVEETEKQKWAKTPFGQLNVKKEDAARIADKNIEGVLERTTVSILKGIAEQLSGSGHVYLYIETEKIFKNVLDMENSDTSKTLIKYAKNNYHYYIPESMKESFKNAITTYRASQSNQ